MIQLRNVCTSKCDNDDGRRKIHNDAVFYLIDQNLDNIKTRYINILLIDYLFYYKYDTISYFVDLCFYCTRYLYHVPS